MGSPPFLRRLRFSPPSSLRFAPAARLHICSSAFRSFPSLPASSRPAGRLFMRVLMSRRRGSAGGGLRIKKKARGFMCGCGGSKAVSISDGSEKSPMATPQTVASTAPLTAMSMSTATTKAAAAAAEAEAPPSSLSSSSLYADTTTDDGPSSMESTPSLSALLRQLGELERSVRFLHAAGAGDEGDGSKHRRSASGGGAYSAGRVEESVAVVKESADPLGDFRGSMLQMIVEKEIVGGAELRELLRRFLSLNSPHHHHLILRAFAEIWEEVFAGHERAPDNNPLLAHRGNNGKKNRRQQPPPAATRGA